MKVSHRLNITNEGEPQIKYCLKILDTLFKMYVIWIFSSKYAIWGHILYIYIFLFGHTGLNPQISHPTIKS